MQSLGRGDWASSSLLIAGGDLGASSIPPESPLIEPWSELDSSEKLLCLNAAIGPRLPPRGVRLGVSAQEHKQLICVDKQNNRPYPAQQP